MKNQSALIALTQDPRILQVFLLSNFLLYGCLFFGWWEQATVYGAALSFSLLTQLLWIKIRHLNYDSLKSALITGLGLCLLLRVNEWYIMALAAVLAISSKFVITHRGKHLFNPTNVAIVLISWSGVGWISPGQWGSGEVLALLLIAGACMVLFEVKRWDVALTFLGSLFLLEFCRSVVYLGWTADVLFHKFNNATLLLFAFFMITDPRSTPDHRTARMLWSAALALLSFLLTQVWYLYQAPMYALFTLSLLTPWLDHLFKGEPFKWSASVPSKQVAGSTKSTQVFL